MFGRATITLGIGPYSSSVNSLVWWIKLTIRWLLSALGLFVSHRIVSQRQQWKSY